ncbi:MAG: class I SAM-dependent methyltransferase [Deltaproteobacteria bacterium]|nr:class I SAM-dependent methyltransferase [Deltaproteobacteria bacterium]
MMTARVDRDARGLLNGVMADRDRDVQAFFQAWSGTYDMPFYQDGLYGPLHRVLHDRASVLARRGRMKVAVDVGIGTGQSLGWLPAVADCVVGVDLSVQMLALAQTRRPPTAVLVRASAAALPLPDAAVDLVVSCFSMHWWPDIARGWRELFRILRPGATALVLVPSSSLLALPAFRAALGRAQLVRWLPPGEYAAMARAAGLATRLPRNVYAGSWLLEGRRPV